jgi:hypothetical protein
MFRYLLGYWHRRMINWLRMQIKCVLVIQKHWRMHKAKIVMNKLRKRKEHKAKKEVKDIEKRFRRQRKIEREVEGYIDNLFKSEMEKRVDNIKKAKTIRITKTNQAQNRTVQQVKSEFMSTQTSQNSKFVSKDIESAKRAIERYQANQHVPGDAQYLKHSSEQPKKIKTKRSIKTSKGSRPVRKSQMLNQPYQGYGMPYTSKPIKIHSESSCTSQTYAPASISSKGVVLTRVRQHANKLASIVNSELC